MSQDAWPRIIIVADGSCGESSFLLGVQSEYIVESCNAYGANAVFERLDQRQVSGFIVILYIVLSFNNVV